jgi:hypothetical protein
VTVYEVVAGVTSRKNGDYAVVVLTGSEIQQEAACVLEELWGRVEHHTIHVRTVRPVQAEVAWEFWQETVGVKGRILVQLRLRDGSRSDEEAG